MIRINQISLKPDQDEKELDEAVRKLLKLKKEDKFNLLICKKSIDARHKPDVNYIYSVNVFGVIINNKNIDEVRLTKKLKNKNIQIIENIKYKFPVKCDKKLKEEQRPVIIGFGPAGMFAALKLAQAGFCPVVYERGQKVEDRKRTVQDFWNGKDLNKESNVQFGEGGAGTFSDGKLNTQIKEKTGRIHEVLECFVKAGADSDILYVNKPHIGTDVLERVVVNIRNEIIRLGGEINFNTRLDELIIENNQIKKIKLFNLQNENSFERECSNLCLSIGHSARDTFEMLDKKGILMKPKAFAIGVRMEHPQTFINKNAYGDCKYELPQADYKVTYQTSKGRGVYSFCMCPGGFVVNASSEKNMLAVNGMSYSKRDSSNANSAIIVSVTPDDFGYGTLDGMKFQRKLEKACFEYGNGKIPVQLYDDFKDNKKTQKLGNVIPCIKGDYVFSNLNDILPGFICSSLKEAIPGFSKYISGFDMPDAVLSGVESRTSSPIRILRNEGLQSETVNGLFPCGEGAGYAGGITSASVDGIKVAEQMAQNIS